MLQGAYFNEHECRETRWDQSVARWREQVPLRSVELCIEFFHALCRQNSGHGRASTHFSVVGTPKTGGQLKGYACEQIIKEPVGRVMGILERLVHLVHGLRKCSLVHLHWSVTCERVSLVLPLHGALMVAL